MTQALEGLAVIVGIFVAMSIGVVVLAFTVRWVNRHMKKEPTDRVDDRFFAVHDLFTMMEDRIVNLEHALEEANIPVDKHWGERERQERIERGKKYVREKWGWDI